MLYFLVSCVSFLLLSSSFSQKPFFVMKLLSPSFWAELSSYLVCWFQRSKLENGIFGIPPMRSKKMALGPRMENAQEEASSPLLDLPESVLECILERLSPAELSIVEGVCKSLRETCRSDLLWEKHVKRKWGKVIKEAAYQEWQWYLASRRRPSFSDQYKKKGLLGSLGSVWPFSWIALRGEGSGKSRTSVTEGSIMSLYISLEKGEFSFPAQIHNRENGHVGFMLSCYDAKVSYDSQTDTFQARYLPLARRSIEENIKWDRIRAPPVSTPPYDLHISDCLEDLKPGDHIEIQWRRNKDFPYGWWYGVVSHLDLCDGNGTYCRCHASDTVILEFHQYPVGSRWRKAIINRKNHREEGDEADGFYGGIRKIYDEKEISKWKGFWPSKVLDLDYD